MPSWFPDLTNQEERQRKALAAAVDRDVNAILRACVPLDWKEPGPFTEPAIALHCVHPIENLMVNPEKIGEVRCTLCKAHVEPEIVRDRLDAWKRAQQ